MLRLPPLSLYIHFPWCVKKCPYCDFNSHALRAPIPDKAYLSTLIADLESHRDDFQGRQFASIFIGGGTPSLFPAQRLAELLHYLDKNNHLAQGAEITLEANPGTVEHGDFHQYRQMGINRISLGVQSLQDDKLKVLGRIHHRREVEQAVNQLKQAGIDNFNLDIMHGLPGQMPEDALFDLKAALGFSPTHLSWYQLTIEPNTAYAVKPPSLPSEEILEEIEIAGKALLSEKRFQQYETSAYAFDRDYRSRHNLNYWRFGDYIGIGAGAHGKVTFPEQGVIKRHWKRKHPLLYLKEKTFPYGQSEINKKDLPYEFMLNLLRLTEGFTPFQFESATGLGISAIRPMLRAAETKGLLKKAQARYRPTALGQRFLNDLIELFMP